MSLATFLEKLPYFAELPSDRLQTICGEARRLTLSSGEVLLAEGSPSEAMYVVLEGDFEVTGRIGDRDVPLGRAGPGHVLGEMSLLEDVPRSATARALGPAVVAEITRDVFQELLEHPASILALLRTVVGRLRAREGAVLHSEKMAALGTMTAGLMHELNNPAAAIRRAAARLEETVEAWRRLSGELPADALARVVETTPPAELGPSTSLERADREEEVRRVLERREVEDAWDLAPALAGAGWDPGTLEELGSGPEGATALRWLALQAEVDDLLGEVGSAATRISELIGSVKRYSRLDEAPEQEVDVHEGLEDTLVILRHKMGAEVEVVRRYHEGLPRIEANGRELNQVWTNLVDNALDAMGGSGRLELRTRPEEGRVVVEVADDGPGIPAEARGRIFEPFFTTKAPGEGTGLGLHLAYSIVSRHGGEIGVDSGPEGTTFTVTLPVRRPG